MKWQATLFGCGRKDNYHTKLLKTRDDAIAYTRDWASADGVRNGYEGKGKFRQRRYEGNVDTVGVFRDDEIVGVVHPRRVYS
jgi:hypothetical protein